MSSLARFGGFLRVHRIIVVVFGVLISGHQAFAQSEYYVTASRRAVVRDFHDGDAAGIERLDAGEFRACLAGPDGEPLQSNQFYHITTELGELGWVSRYVVRVHKGSLPISLETDGNSSLTSEEENRQDSDAVVSGSRHTETQVSLFRSKHTGDLSLPSSEIELVNEGYVVGYDPRLKIAAWVQYKLTRDDFVSGERVTAFRPDARLQPAQQSTLDDYETAPTRAIWGLLGMTMNTSANENYYARGHIVPDASQTRTEELQRDTYLLSNMAPHVQMGFNSGTWSSLERQIRSWCTSKGELYIIAGPIFRSSSRALDPYLTEDERLAVLDDPDEIPLVRAQPPTQRQVIYNVLGNKEVAVPSAMFCIVIDNRNPEQILALGFIINNARRTAGQGRSLSDTLVSIDEIERLTGLDLLSGLADGTEAALEAQVPVNLWP